jgi:hypothetical protein
VFTPHGRLRNLDQPRRNALAGAKTDPKTNI